MGAVEKRVPKSAGRLGLAQVIIAQVAALAAVVTAYAYPSLPMAAIGLAALLLALPVTTHVRGRWWYEAIGTWLHLRGRRRYGLRAADRARSAGPYWADLAALSPHLVLRTVAHENLSLGIGEDHLGWFAAIAVTPPDGLSRDERGSLRLDSIARLADPLTTVQVVVRQTQLAGPRQTATPGIESYRALREALGVAPQRDAWIAVRIGQRDAATVGGEGIHRKLGSTVSRVSEALTAEAVDHRVLDGPALRQALLGAYGPEPHDPRIARRPAAPRESWSHWRTGRTLHVCYAVTRWPDPAPPDLLTQVADVPGSIAVCTTVVAGVIRDPYSDEGPLGARVLLRVTVASDTTARCLRHLRTTARRLGIGLVRLDGEQGPTVYATMPTAATDGWGRLW